MNDRDAGRKLLTALQHPLRREILRTVPRLGEPVSPRAIAEELRMPLPNVGYHVRLLAHCDVLRLVDLQPASGSVKHFYERTDLLDHPLAKAMLDLDDDVGGSESIDG